MFWAIALVLSGWLVFGCAFAKGLFTPVQGPHQDFNAFVYTLDVFLPVVDLHQESDWVLTSANDHRHLVSDSLCPGALQSICVKPTEMFDRMLEAGFAKLWFYVEIIMGWVLLGIVTAGLAGVLQHKTE